MSLQSCPKCGATIKSDYQWLCGSSPNFDGTVVESVECVKDQLAATEYRAMDFALRLVSVRRWADKHISDSCFCELEGMGGCAYCRMEGKSLYLFLNHIPGTTKPLAVESAKVRVGGNGTTHYAKVRLPVDIPVGTEVTVVIMEKEAG